jgi:hypothetical protein
MKTTISTQIIVSLDVEIDVLIETYGRHENNRSVDILAVRLEDGHDIKDILSKGSIDMLREEALAEHDYETRFGYEDGDEQ